MHIDMMEKKRVKKKMNQEQGNENSEEGRRKRRKGEKGDEANDTQFILFGDYFGFHE